MFLFHSFILPCKHQYKFLYYVNYQNNFIRNFQILTSMLVLMLKTSENTLKGPKIGDLYWWQKPVVSRAPCVKWTSFDSTCVISSPHPMFDHLLESSRWHFWNNKNWVTVPDKCAQINVKFKWYTFLKNIFWTEGQRNGRMVGWTVQFYYAPKIIWGHKNTRLIWSSMRWF